MGQADGFEYYITRNFATLTSRLEGRAMQDVTMKWTYTVDLFLEIKDAYIILVGKSLRKLKIGRTHKEMGGKH
jgi:hypothetical protein